MNQPQQTIDWNEENVKTFWDFYSQFPHLYFTYQHGERIVNLLSDFVHEGSRILDYGCGTGFLVNHLIKKPVKVYGLDNSIQSVNSVNGRFQNVSNFYGAFEDNEMLKNKDFKNFFDVVFLVEVVEHLTDDYLSNVFRNIRHLLKPNGIVLITTPNKEDLSASFVYCPVSKVVFHRWQHVRSWSKESLTEVLKKFDFSTNEALTTDFSRTTTKGKLRATVEALANLIRKKRVAHEGPHLVLVAEKR